MKLNYFKHNETKKNETRLSLLKLNNAALISIK